MLARAVRGSSRGGCGPFRRLLSSGADGDKGKQMVPRGESKQLEVPENVTGLPQEDGKPSKEFIDFFTKLASQVKQTDITAKQQLLDSKKSQDFRALVSKRKRDTVKEARFTADELRIAFYEMQQGKFPEHDTEKMKRIFAKYELIQ